MTVLPAALASLLAYLDRTTNTLAIEGQTSKSTDATTAPLLTHISKLTGTQLGDLAVTAIIIEACGPHVELSLYARANPNVPSSMVAIKSLLGKLKTLLSADIKETQRF